MDAKKPGREADTPALLPWLVLICETVLSRKRAAALLRDSTVSQIRTSQGRSAGVSASRPGFFASICTPLEARFDGRESNRTAPLSTVVGKP